MDLEEPQPDAPWVQRGLCAPVRCDRDGRTGPTPRAARGPHWRSTGRGWHVPANVPQSPEQRILEASVLLPEHGGVTGWAQLRWKRLPWFDGIGPNGLARPVTLVTAGDHIRAQPGVAVSKERLDPRDLDVVDGIRVTNDVRSVWFEMRYAVDEREAAVALSMAAYSDVVSVAELEAWSNAHPGWTGAPRCRDGIWLAEENVWSPQELRTAMVWRIDAELPRLLCNEPLFDRRGRHLATPDLIDLEAGVAVDYHGGAHLQMVRRTRDVDSGEIYREHGLEYLTVLGPHLADRGALAARMHRVRSRARFEAESARSWTTTPPLWWAPTHSVALRRSLTDDQRQQVLGYRIAA